MLDIHISELNRSKDPCFQGDYMYVCTYLVQIETFLVLQGGADCMGCQNKRYLNGWSL